MTPTILWFRHDLRLDDHPALRRAAEGPIVCVYILDDDAEGGWPMGAASRWWLHRSLASLGESLARIGARLLLRRGAAIEVLREIVGATGASRVVASERWEPAARRHEREVIGALAQRGVETAFLDGALLHAPERIRTAAGDPFKVFTPFWRCCLGHGFDALPLTPPTALIDAGSGLASLPLQALELEPSIAWDGGLAQAWTPGEAGARAQWRRFAADGLASYATGRDLCGTRGTSALSPHLHFGEISPRRIWHEMAKVERSWFSGGAGATAVGSAARDGARDGLRVFRAELGWREFAHHVLAAFPRTTDEPMRPAFARFPWQRDASLLRAWQRGLTGYPLVDAGMRQLWRTGWMHNRVRMVAASFLVKHLLQPWQEGARWFWDTLVDADLASNTMGWQWSAGCGADAAPYFRIFNPVLQGEKFDPDGAYIRQWLPELARLPSRFIHQPWKAPAGERPNPSEYPSPIVDHATARNRALEAFDEVREGGPS